MVKTYGKKNVKRNNKRKVYRKRKSNLVKKVNSLCKQVIQRTAEKKHLDMNPLLYGWTNTTLTNDNPFDAINLASYYQLAQGNADGQRLGNSVKFTKFDLCVNAMTINSNNVGPFIMDIWVGVIKPTQQYPPTQTQLGSLLQDGSTSVGQDARTAQLLRRVNTDKFKIYAHRRFRIGNSTYSTNAQSNNDFGMFKNLRIPIKALLGKMTYDDVSAIPSKYMYMWCHAVAVDSGSVVQTSLPQMEFYIDAEYIDI